MVAHYVEVLHNVLEPAYQYFVFISPLATIVYNTIVLAIGKYSIMYWRLHINILYVFQRELDDFTILHTLPLATIA